MNVFSIAGAMWRQKWVTIPVILLTVLGVFYIMMIKPPTYQAGADVLLTSPPASPTPAQIAANSHLGRINTNNSFASLGDLDLVADVVIEIVTAPDARQALVQAGANPQYQVSLDTSQGNPPAIDITGVGPTPQVAMQSAQLVADAVSGDLRQIQVNQHINSTYMISSIEYVKPTSAASSKSTKIRTTILVVALGFIVLLVAVSVSQGLAERKAGKGRRGKGSASRTGDREELATTPPVETYDRSLRSAVPMGESRRVSNDRFWSQTDAAQRFD